MRKWTKRISENLWKKRNIIKTILLLVITVTFSNPVFGDSLKFVPYKRAPTILIYQPKNNSIITLKNEAKQRDREYSPIKVRMGFWNEKL